MKNAFLVALCVSFGLVACKPGGSVRPKDPTLPPVSYEYPAVKKEAANKIDVLYVKTDLSCDSKEGFNLYSLCEKEAELTKMEDAINTKLLENLKNRGFTVEAASSWDEFDQPQKESALFVIDLSIKLQNVYTPKKDDVLSPGKEIDKDTGEETDFIEAIRYNGTLQTTASFKTPLIEPLTGVSLRKEPSVSVSTKSPVVYAEWYNPEEKPGLLNNSSFGLGVSLVKDLFKKEEPALPPRATGSEDLRVVQNKQLTEVYKLIMAKLDSAYTTADLKKYVASAKSTKKRKVY